MSLQPQMISELYKQNQLLSKHEAFKHYNVDPRVKYDMTVRSYTENRLEKDVHNCKDIMNLPIWTQRKEVTMEKYLEPQKNPRLVIGGTFQLMKVSLGASCNRGPERLLSSI
jgi:hypothetical protein